MKTYYTPGMSMAQVEKEVIEDAMKFYCGNKTQCAKSLGIAYGTLDDRIKTYKADREKASLAAIAERKRVEELTNKARGIKPGEAPVLTEDKEEASREGPKAPSSGKVIVHEKAPRAAGHQRRPN